MTTAVIIDDEQKGRLALREKIRNYCKGVKIVGEASDGFEGVEIINEYHPDVVFLDIEMPGMDGFEMIQALQEMDFHLIFTTAYDHYAIKAIKYSAFDYLLKPVDIEELKSAVERVNSQSRHVTNQKLDALHKNLQNRPTLGKIAIPTQEGLLFFNTLEIIHLEAQSNYTMIYFEDYPKLLASRTLKDFEDLLPSENFYRTHHSHIINLHYIRRYLRGDGGQIELQNKNFVPLSRRKKKEFLNIINQGW
ncbi:LytR/AlgR family response regulator transcription factor [Membranihabitans maritimus]|uniref:LytR/AlgR family response regulator transcription factor n=1 Tax=Membranihabitans maritimus TaxID=2904244 RepID=UPI001F38DF6B|nr:LytTR family DNA-binding domain-containing protein [Membranihabitans maritimus]